MLFAGFSSAYIVLRGVPTWQNIELPSLLWPNTAILLMSSVTIELSRSAIRRNDTQSMKRWLGLGGILGLAFLVGPARSLAATGERWRLSAIDTAEWFLLHPDRTSRLHLLGGCHGIDRGSG